MAQGPKIRLGQIGKAIHRADGKIVDDNDVVEGIVLLRKGAESDATLKGIHAKVKELNDQILPPGVKVVPFLDRSDSVALHDPHRSAQSDRGHHPRRDHAVPCSWAMPAARSSSL